MEPRVFKLKSAWGHSGKKPYSGYLSEDKLKFYVGVRVDLW
ncbi:hypothetical protein PM10SUCC1_37660 [Propionigenium maris DSM 9537]|uniref:Uncharacterized protein n=1 Tax=Propionigenium maris DSM 9537 TaxID=1123000 RepID=A0A9W6GPE6_9FUSO|nr:hypothetical protein PM10SUCC1_37660 [Propionigenium maris DSM 9537]